MRKTWTRAAAVQVAAADIEVFLNGVAEMTLNPLPDKTGPEFQR